MAQAEADTEATLLDSLAGPEGSTSLTDLLVVGPGVLGARLGQLWLQQHPEATVTGQTNTSTRHDKCAPAAGCLLEVQMCVMSDLSTWAGCAALA